MNNKPKLILPETFPAFSAEQQAIVTALEEVIELAKEGRIHTVGIIACMDKGPAIMMQGSAASHLNLGLDKMKAEILRRTE